MITIKTGGMKVKNVEKINNIIIPGKFGEQKILDETHLSQICSTVGVSVRKSKVLIQFLKQNKIIRAVPHIMAKFANERQKLAEYFTTAHDAVF